MTANKLIKTREHIGSVLLALAVVMATRAGAGTMVADVVISNALPGATLSGTNPYLYDFAGDSLEMAGFKVSSPITATRNVVLTNLTALTDSGGTGAIHTFTSSSVLPGYVSVYASSGLTLGGSVLTYGRGGGAVTLSGSSISVSNINARSIWEYVASGAVTLTATGNVAVGGYITTRNVGTAGAVSITSGASIVVGGTTNGFSIDAGGGVGGAVSLWATNVVLAGGITANGKSNGDSGTPGKAITIHDGSGGPARLVIGGSLLTYGGGGGAVTVVAPEISVTNIDTRSYYSDPSAPGGAVTLTATGTVAVSGYITTGKAGTAGNVSITSGASIVVGGTTNGFSIEAGAETGGSVSLWATNVILAGGIAANGKSDGTKGAGKAVTVHDGSGGPARVAIGGDVLTYGRGGGAVSVTATDFSVSNINTRSSYEYNAAGSVTVTVTKAVAVGGYITTRGVGKWGNVSITADGSIAVAGTTNGIGIETLVTMSNGAYYGGNITLVSSNGDITVTGGFDASAAYGVSRRGAISLSATNGGITVGSLDANLFKTISIQAAAGQPVYVTGAITNFSVSESPKTITFPAGSVIGNDMYYLLKENTAIPLSGTYAIFSGTSDTGRLLKPVQDQGSLLIVW
jgi:hypothetical protein